MCCGCVPLPQSLTWVSSWGSARLPPSCKSNYLKYKSNLSYTRDKNNKLVQDLWLLRSVCLPRIFCFTICPVNYTNRVHWCVFGITQPLSLTLPRVRYLTFTLTIIRKCSLLNLSATLSSVVYSGTILPLLTCSLAISAETGNTSTSPPQYRLLF